MGHNPQGSADSETDPSTPTPETRQIPEAVLELDHVHETLSHPRRRYLCYTLLEQTEWSLTDLATKIASWELEIPEHAVTADQRTAVYVSLYHSHVPNLVENRVVSFDESSETLSAAESADQVLAALEGMGASLNGAQEAHARSEIDDDS